MHDLREKILALQAESAGLEPHLQERSHWQELANQSLNRFLEQLPTSQAYFAGSSAALQQLVKELDSATQAETLLPCLVKGLSSLGITTAGPGHLGFVPGGGLYAGALADHIAATLNVFSADAFAAPLAVHIHQESLRWLCSMVGYDAKAWGDITSGGSHATLTALHVARHALGLKPRDYHRSCVYLSEHTHHCSQKALHILFSDEICLRRVPMQKFRMDPQALEAMILEDQKAGLRPAIVIGTAGSTNLGLIDPLEDLADVALRHGLWLHVDAACGGFFALCDERRDHFQGISRADSVVLDPHKGMFLPYGCGAVLIKKGQLLAESLSHSGSYLQDRDESELLSPMDYSMELTRPFRSLRLWLTLKLHGATMIKKSLQEKLALADYCRQRLQNLAGIELIGPMDLSIMAFRLRPAGAAEQADRATQSLLQRILAKSEIFLSSTTIDNQFVIRVAIMSFRTHLATVDRLLAIIDAESTAVLADFAYEGESI